MKKKEFKEMRQKQTTELGRELDLLRVRLNDLKFDFSSGKVKNIREAQGVKKSIAQLLTVIKEKQK